MRSWLHPFIFHTSEKWNIHPKEVVRSQLHDFIPSSLIYQRAEQKKSWDHDFILSSLRTKIYIPKKSWDHDFIPSSLNLWYIRDTKFILWRNHAIMISPLHPWYISNIENEIMNVQELLWTFTYNFIQAGKPKFLGTPLLCLCLISDWYDWFLLIFRILML